jgi:hypothetical protein
LRLSFLPLDH